jgi:hypothetical protein
MKRPPENQRRPIFKTRGYHSRWPSMILLPVSAQTSFEGGTSPMPMASSAAKGRIHTAV